jgi:acyl homoserine lactone synthase
MLRYLYADQLHDEPALARQMFRARAEQFRTRLGWDVAVGPDGEERDEYDALNPLYVIWQDGAGRHQGSMRFLPTVGRVMVNEHFGHLTTGPITSPLIWECTRFCLSPDADGQVAAGLMLGGGEIMQGFGVTHFVGVFDARMVRIYRMIGSSPEVLGGTGEGRERISVGLWSFDADAQARVAARAGVTPALSRLWFERAFGATSQVPVAKAG